MLAPTSSSSLLRAALLLAMLLYVFATGTTGASAATGLFQPQPFLSDAAAKRALARFESNNGRAKKGPMSRIGLDLALVHEEYRDYEKRGGKAFLKHDFKSRLKLARIKNNLISIDAIASGNWGELWDELANLGMRDMAVSGRIISGRIPVNQLPALAQSGRLQLARPSYVITHAGLVTSEGDIAQASDVARASVGLDGSGITVGILSDSYDCLGGAGTDVSSDDLPAAVNVLQEYASCNDGTDEGRAMMQIIHDVAPGADFAFHTAFNGMADFANGIVELAIIGGAEVITDDVIYLAEPMFQDGLVAQAVDRVHAMGVAYYSSAGNQASQSYEADFVFSGITGFRSGYIRHDFDRTAGVDTLQAVTIPGNTEVIFVLQWQDPAFSVSGAPGAATDLDMFLYNASGSRALAGSTANNIGGDPVEVFSFANLSGVAQTYQLSIEHFAGPIPRKIKYVHYGSMSIEEYDTSSATLYGHANAAGAVATGAVRYDRTPAFGTFPPVIEPYSARGGTQILFDLDGNPVNLIRQKPEIVAPDGVSTTFFGFDSSIDLDNFPNFFGTSAAAPHAAGVAALFKQLDTRITPPEITAAMTVSAIDMNSAGFDFVSGHGLLQADGALAVVDRDTDRVINSSDNCPDVFNPLQENYDGDASGDACDADDDNDGLNDATEANLGSDVLNPDTDADGVIDGVDNCLLLANPDQADSDNDGTGDQCDADNDIMIVPVDTGVPDDPGGSDEPAVTSTDTGGGSPGLLILLCIPGIVLLLRPASYKCSGSKHLSSE